VSQPDSAKQTAAKIASWVAKQSDSGYGSRHQSLTEWSEKNDFALAPVLLFLHANERASQLADGVAEPM
jgi:hypothetical protein